MEELDNQEKLLKTRKKILMKDHKFMTSNLVEMDRTVIDKQEELLSIMKERDTEKLKNLENLQQMFYKETVKMANLCEDIDKILEFMNELVQTNIGSKKRVSYTNLKTFNELLPDDKDNINDLWEKI